MSAPVNVTITGAVKVKNVPERACFNTWVDFVKSLEQYLSVEVPASISNVIIGTQNPSDSDKEKLWFRRATNGQFIGIYAFQDGAWRPFYFQPPGQVTWMYGNSNSIPEGFRLVTNPDPALPLEVAQALTAQYVPLSSGGFQYFAVIYVGFGIV